MQQQTRTVLNELYVTAPFRTAMDVEERIVQVVVLGLMMTAFPSAVLYIDKHGEVVVNLVVGKCNQVSCPAMSFQAMSVIKLTGK
jgi:hypothetical protein